MLIKQYLIRQTKKEGKYAATGYYKTALKIKRKNVFDAGILLASVTFPYCPRCCNFAATFSFLQLFNRLLLSDLSCNVVFHAT